MRDLDLNQSMMRIPQYLAACGLGSRRDCEALVHEGYISIDGVRITDPSICVTPEQRLSYLGQPLYLQKPRMFLYYKRVGTIVSRKESRFSVFDDLKKIDQNLVCVGRLDMMSEGLMIVTNNGRIAHEWETSDTPRHYKVLVEVRGRPDWSKISKNLRNLVVDSIKYRPIGLKYEFIRQGLYALDLFLHEGKNREIRKVCDYHKWRIRKLIRLGYGPFTLDMLGRRKYIEVKPALPILPRARRL